MTKRSPATGTKAAGENKRTARPDDRLDERATARWQRAEGRLYPLIMLDPDLYEAAVTLMSQARDVLRTRCDTLSALIDVDAADVLAQCPSAAQTIARGVDGGTVVDAARASHWRELTVPQAAHDLPDLIGAEDL